MKLVPQIQEYLYKRIDSRYLHLFRVLFGFLMFLNILKYIRIDLVGNMFVKPALNFPYPGLEFIQPLPETAMYVLLGLLAIASVFVILGFLLRWACIVLAVGLFYILLLDKSLFNNHIYLFVLLSALLSFTNADSALSIRSFKFKFSPIPNWQIFILKLQITIVYFFGGLVKLKADWVLRYEPVKSGIMSFVRENPDYQFLSNQTLVAFICYGGLVIDLVFPFLLWFRKTRLIAIIAIGLFNVLNFLFFNDIGYFPFVMMTALILFFDNEKVQKTKQKEASTKSSGIFKGWGLVAVSYFIFQVTFPLRGFLLPNDIDYTTIGNRFSWRMKADSRELKEIHLMMIEGPRPQDTIPIEFNTFINTTQIVSMVSDPRSISTFGRFLKEESMKYGAIEPRVFARLKISYNGRPVQDYIKPGTDISSVDVNPLRKIEWINPIIDPE